MWWVVDHCVYSDSGDFGCYWDEVVDELNYKQAKKADRGVVDNP